MQQDKHRKYVFKSTDCEYAYNPKKALFKFYQICVYVNPHTHKRDVRKIEINEMGSIVKISDTSITDDQFKYFIKTHRENKYKLYSTYDLSLVDLPNPGNILQSQSELLNNDNITYGYAKF